MTIKRPAGQLSYHWYDDSKPHVNCLDGVETMGNGEFLWVLPTLSAEFMRCYLTALLQGRLLVSEGFERGMCYLLPWQEREAKAIFNNDALALPPELGALPPELGALPPELSALPPELSALPPELSVLPPELGAEPPEQPLVFLEATQLGEKLLAELELVAKPVREKSRVVSSVQYTILTLIQKVWNFPSSTRSSPC